MHQVKRMHRTLVVLAVGLLALAAPLVAYANDGGPKSAEWQERHEHEAREAGLRAFALSPREPLGSEPPEVIRCRRATGFLSARTARSPGRGRRCRVILPTSPTQHLSRGR